MSRVIGVLCCAFALLCAPAAAATDGQLVAVARTAAGDRLVTLNPDGTGMRTVFSGQRLSSPGWSPDGNRIALADGHRVLVLDPATGATQTVLDEPGAASPTWSPDGSRIALLRGSRVVTVAVDGGDPRAIRLRVPGPVGWIAWSPAGDRLAYGTSAILRTIGIDGGDDEPLVTATDLGDPAWSPDGRRIAYRDGGRLRIVPSAGGEPADLTRTGGAEPDWSPDGREVVYSSAGGLRAIAVDSGAIRAIAAPPDAQTTLAEPDWQPCVTGVTISCTSAPPPPSCPENVTVTTVAEQPVDLPLGGCTDPSGRPLSIAVTRGPEHGTLAGSRYTPAPGFVGQDSVLYQASAEGTPSNLARVTIFVVPRTVPAAVPGTPRAPYLSALETPQLDARGHGRLRITCDLPCTAKLRFTVRLRSHRSILGPVLERTLAAGAIVTLRLRAPARRLVRSAWVRGTVTGDDGLARSFRIPVRLR